MMVYQKIDGSWFTKWLCPKDGGSMVKDLIYSEEMLPEERHKGKKVVLKCLTCGLELDLADTLKGEQNATST